MSSSNNKFGTIIQIGSILVSEEVVTEYFACDYAKCKGICCIIGDSGAPLEEDELQDLEVNYPEYSKLMRPQGLAQVAKDGFFSIDRDNDLVTPTVDGSGECAYTTFDRDGNFASSRQLTTTEKKGAPPRWTFPPYSAKISIQPLRQLRNTLTFISFLGLLNELQSRFIVRRVDLDLNRIDIIQTQISGICSEHSRWNPVLPQHSHCNLGAESIVEFGNCLEFFFPFHILTSFTFQRYCFFNIFER